MQALSVSVQPDADQLLCGPGGNTPAVAPEGHCHMSSPWFATPCANARVASAAIPRCSDGSQRQSPSMPNNRFPQSSWSLQRGPPVRGACGGRLPGIGDRPRLRGCLQLVAAGGGTTGGIGKKLKSPRGSEVCTNGMIARKLDIPLLLERGIRSQSAWWHSPHPTLACYLLAWLSQLSVCHRKLYVLCLQQY